MEFRRNKTTYVVYKVVFPRMDALTSNVSKEAALASTGRQYGSFIRKRVRKDDNLSIGIRLAPTRNKKRRKTSREEREQTFLTVFDGRRSR